MKSVVSVMEIRPRLRDFSLEVEKELHLLWDILATFKQVEEGKMNPEDVIRFQFKLVKVLHEISQYYRLLSNARSRVRKVQKKLGAKEYYRQNKELTTLIDFINHLLVISRSLGDAFVFTFYSMDREYLNIHLARNPESLLLPAGVGGQGEMEFVKNFKMIDGNLVLYHGITNILRIGDFTLFNLKDKKVTAIGELKSGRPDEKTFTLNATLIGPKHREKQIRIKKKDSWDIEDQSTTFNFPNEDRYKKQVQVMKDSFNYLDRKRFPNEYLDDKLYSKSKNEILKELGEEPIEKFVVFRNVDRSCCISRWSYIGECIFDRWMNSEVMDGVIDEDDVQKNYFKILNPEITNQVVFGQIHFGDNYRIHQAIGSKPLFWSDIDMIVLKKIYFREFIFTTMYNVGYLVNEMKQRDFVFEYDEVQKEYCFIKYLNGEKQFVVNGLDYFCDMVTRYLQDESAVIQAIERVAEAAVKLKRDETNSNRISLNIIMK